MLFHSTELMGDVLLYHRLERLEHLAAKFNHKADIHQGWTSGKEAALQANDIEGANLAAVLVCYSCYSIVVIYDSLVALGIDQAA